MRRKLNLVLVVTLLFVGGVATAQLGSVLKGGGVAFLVSRFGKDINKAINDLTRTQDSTATYATKVVPILSAGTGTQVGACQVMGPPDAVNKVSAVAQIEGNFRAAGVRIRGLVPVATSNVTNIKRVPGVGISGLIDLKL
ncbi:MAG: hypothetical protein RMJ43_04675 [Chloroherpetonaceae bacterium]|nr:hypothetical protein [Chthonomonadaceae bacterium]MDW8207108.1 hypothetical protein [Chloroherpetonaceae bacterium]